VLQRLAPLSAGERFDLIVATNILVYYGVFEQSLALTNLAAMLRPGGLLLCSEALPLLPSIPMSLVGYTDVVYDTELKSGARVRWYQRK
jgi:2-polyprenyl-3-methyl-5-hydroxy-6-metoxy-1,4-benzoquinol methylase